MKLTTHAGFVGIAMALQCAAAAAAPLYLSCEFSNPTGKPQTFNFLLDKTTETFGVFVPSSGSQRMEKGSFSGNKASLNEGTVAWEIDMANRTAIRDKRMVDEKDNGTCKAITAQQSGFEE